VLVRDGDSHVGLRPPESGLLNVADSRSRVTLRSDCFGEGSGTLGQERVRGQALAKTKEVRATLAVARVPEPPGKIYLWDTDPGL
jgi:hypothetical protein